MGDIFTSTVTGRTKTWTVSIDKSGYSSTTYTMDLDPDIDIVIGNPFGQDDTWGLWPANVRLRYHDPDDTMWDELTGASVDPDDYTITVTDSDDFKYQFKPALDTMQRVVSTQTGSPVIDLYGFDRLEDRFDGVDAYVTATPSVWDIIRNRVLDLWQWRADTVFAYYDSNSTLTGSNININSLHLPPIAWSREAGDYITAREQVEILLDILNLRVWQRGYDSSSLTNMPRLFISHPWAVGQSVSTGNAAAEITYAGSVTEQATGIAAAAQAVGDIAAGAVFWPLRKLDYVTTTVDLTYGYAPGTPGTALEVTYFRGGDLDSSTGEYVNDDSTSVTYTSPGRGNSGYKAQITKGIGSVIDANVKQGSISVRQGTRMDVDVKFYHAVDAISPGQADFYVQVIVGSTVEFEDSVTSNVVPGASWDGMSQYTNTDNVFEATESGQVWLVIGSKDTVDDPLTNATAVEFTANATELYIDDVEFRINFDTTDRWVHDEEQSTLASGGRYERRSSFENVTRWIGPSGSTVAYLEGLTTDAAYIIEAGPSAVDWDSIIQLTAQNVLEDRDDTALMIVGELDGLLPPEVAFTYGGNTYRAASGVRMRLLTETTEGTWREKIKTWGT